jgi:hypothetical protein
VTLPFQIADYSISTALWQQSRNSGTDHRKGTAGIFTGKTRSAAVCQRSQRETSGRHRPSPRPPTPRLDQRRNRPTPLLSLHIPGGLSGHGRALCSASVMYPPQQARTEDIVQTGTPDLDARTIGGAIFIDNA